jgi:ATP/maltotriose-dependent transcriptional regulator MalT
LRRAEILISACVYRRHSDPPAALVLAKELAALGRSLSDDRATAYGSYIVSNCQAWAQPDESLRTADDAIYFARKAGMHHMAGACIHNKAWANYWLGRPEEAFSLAKESERAVRDADFPWGLLSTGNISSIAATCSGRLRTGLEEAENLLRLTTELSAPTFACFAERHLGETYMYLGDAGAPLAFARARALAESIDDTYCLAFTDMGLGHLEVSLGQDDHGYELLEAANSKLEAFGLDRMCVNNRAVMAEMAMRRGDLRLARRHLDACTWRLPRTPDPEGVPVLRAEARLARADGDWSRSHALACDGVEQAAGAGHLLWAIDLLELAAVTGADLGRAAEAARLLGAAECQREATGYRRWAPAEDELAPVLAGVQKALGQEPFDQAFTEGRALTLPEAVAYARRGRGSHSRSVSGWGSLTRTEREVVSLVVKRLSNAEIAGRMFVSTTTVKSHLTRVFAKLGVADRHQLAQIPTVHMTGGRR